jgi:hypothetical protein
MTLVDYFLLMREEDFLKCLECRLYVLGVENCP